MASLSEELGLRINYASNFVVLVPKKREMDSDTKRVLEEAGVPEVLVRPRSVCLVESSVLGSKDPSTVTDGDTPSITITRWIGGSAPFIRKHFCRDMFRTNYGGVVAYRLPGSPGPHGDGLFYYIASLDDGSLTEFLAQKEAVISRIWNRLSTEPTHYDKEIERLIGTIAVLPGVDGSPTEAHPAPDER